MTTTENNRADALIDERIEDAIYRHIPPKIALENAKALYAMAVELLVASPVEQFAPSPLTERDYDLHEHEQGLYRKFDVRRVDGSSEPGGKHHDCEYFVLDMTHDQHARAALRAYADACASTHPELSADLIARYALAPIEQPAAAPIVSAPASDARECLMDVVSHHHDFVTACKSIKGELHACGAHDSAAYWQKQIDVLDRMKAQAERALATSANETGAEGAQKEAVMLLLQARDELCLIEWEGEDPPERIHTLFDKIEAFVTRSPAMAAEALAEEHSTIECQAHSGPDCTECGGTGVWSGKADERAASWHCEDPVQKCRAQCDSCAKQARAALKAIVDERAECIAWANANGFTKYHESMCAAWEERARRAAQQLSAEIRELKVKLGSYEREREDQIRYLAAQSEEIAGLKQQLAHADARVGLTATVIQKCIDSCAAEYLEDVTGHPEDAAYCQGITDCIDALNRLKTADWSAILAAHSGQSEPETATVARIEQLRKALFESRDAMRVMSNWVKKSDPAGHSWAVRMVDRANAALNGEPEPRAEVMLFADNDERDEFIRVCQDFDDDGETCVDYELLMKWASNGLLDCDHFTITKKGRAAIDAARTGASS
ncbi:gp03 [Burkholderia pseudomallei]|nr:gp03 [Burkholderia pseudomallei]CAJ7848219.1 gp03 [Burkholderia pseudomallei]CAJ8222239.1 gp03 [Burkholderia pseudomallei]CAJ9603959.1 gp03 [Burkholderia pseudomallei]